MFIIYTIVATTIFLVAAYLAVDAYWYVNALLP